MQKLNKDEMKNVMGGGGPVTYPYTCTCKGGSVGQWTYPNGDPSGSQVSQDVGYYCASNEADCGHYPPALP